MSVGNQISVGKEKVSRQRFASGVELLVGKYMSVGKVFVDRTYTDRLGWSAILIPDQLSVDESGISDQLVCWQSKRIYGAPTTRLQVNQNLSAIGSGFTTNPGRSFYSPLWV
jgi:hypothetical protein